MRASQRAACFDLPNHTMARDTCLPISGMAKRLSPGVSPVGNPECYIIVTFICGRGIAVTMPDLKIVSDLKPVGDQPAAIEELVDGLRSGLRHQTLLGATGT